LRREVKVWQALLLVAAAVWIGRFLPKQARYAPSALLLLVWPLIW
jgi:hypothetical protein